MSPFPCQPTFFYLLPTDLILLTSNGWMDVGRNKHGLIAEVVKK